MNQQMSRQDIFALHELPFPELIFQAITTHRSHHDPQSIQLSRLLSIKTGGCRENCKYCPQSAHHHKVKLKAERLWDVDAIVRSASEARNSGAQRFCMGAAWSSPPHSGPAYESLLTAAREVKNLGLEVCMTLGMLSPQQAEDLSDAGVDYYNHNLDTSPEYYKKIITTRTYQDRLDTLKCVREAGMKVCCGGIIGMGETLEDRIGLLHELSALDPHPESVPINQFVKIPGTPLQPDSELTSIELIKMIATTRMVLPTSVIRLSAGRSGLSAEAQALCYLVGAGSIFIGEKLLTTGNPTPDQDEKLLATLGLTPAASP